MKGIQIPILAENSVPSVAKVTIQVSLDSSTAKGIHMSRLYAVIQTKLANSQLSWGRLEEVCAATLESHREISKNFKLKIQFPFSLQMPSLVSDNKGWKTYPVCWTYLSKNGKVRRFLSVLVDYSSTCPASAALARQLIQEKFEKDFFGASEPFDYSAIRDWLGTSEGILATPHAQRSCAKVHVELNPLKVVTNTDLIQWIEVALGTPVQAYVKRVDEQEFALRNGQNLMFCEDAARKVKAALIGRDEFLRVKGEFRHFESLHQHDAVAVFL